GLFLPWALSFGYDSSSFDLPFSSPGWPLSAPLSFGLPCSAFWPGGLLLSPADSFFSPWPSALFSLVIGLLAGWPSPLSLALGSCIGSPLASPGSLPCCASCLSMALLSFSACCFKSSSAFLLLSLPGLFPSAFWSPIGLDGSD